MAAHFTLCNILPSRFSWCQVCSQWGRCVGYHICSYCSIAALSQVYWVLNTSLAVGRRAHFVGLASYSYASTFQFFTNWSLVSKMKVGKMGVNEISLKCINWPGGRGLLTSFKKGSQVVALYPYTWKEEINLGMRLVKWLAYCISEVCCSPSHLLVIVIALCYWWKMYWNY